MLHNKDEDESESSEEEFSATVYEGEKHEELVTSHSPHVMISQIKAEPSLVTKDFEQKQIVEEIKEYESRVKGEETMKKKESNAIVEQLLTNIEVLEAMMKEQIQQDKIMHDVDVACANLDSFLEIKRLENLKTIVN